MIVISVRCGMCPAVADEKWNSQLDQVTDMLTMLSNHGWKIAPNDLEADLCPNCAKRNHGAVLPELPIQKASVTPIKKMALKPRRHECTTTKCACDECGTVMSYDRETKQHYCDNDPCVLAREEKERWISEEMLVDRAAQVNMIRDRFLNGRWTREEENTPPDFVKPPKKTKSEGGSIILNPSNIVFHTPNPDVGIYDEIARYSAMQEERAILFGDITPNPRRNGKRRP